jgi:hypothetical protein
MYINSSKYRQLDNNGSTKYKNSITKGSVESKSGVKKSGNTSQLKKNQSVKIINKITKDIGPSYTKASTFSTNKYPKTARGTKKSETNSSKILEHSNNQMNNSSKASHSGYNSRSGISTNTVNTKSYNTLLAIMQNKEQEYATIAGGIYS